MTDASAKIILVHGTWGRGFHPDRDAKRKAAGEPAEPRWFEARSKFCAALLSGLSGLVQATDLSAFLWSGANSIEERSSAVARLAKTLDESLAAAPNAEHFIIAHSHGGNIALDAREAMSRDALNVNIVTLATPFLSIYAIAPRLADRLFAICLSIGLTMLASYIFWAIGTSVDTTLIYAVFLISLLSLLFGAASFCGWVYRLIRKRRPLDKPPSGTLNSAMRINNQSLIAGGLLFCVGWLSFGVTADLLLLLLPTLLLFFFSISATGTFLYSARYSAPHIRQYVPSLKILRSHRDEASLALFFGEITSFLSRIAASISIIIPTVVAACAALFVCLAIGVLISKLPVYQDCLARGNECALTIENNLLPLGMAALELGTKSARYMAFGVFICVTFVVLAAVCKSLFGRELLYRSLNATVDVYDTPDGSKSYKVDWCSRVKDSAFGLRHSLYNNLDAVNKIVAHINHVCATGVSRGVPAVAMQPAEAPKLGIWRIAAATAVVAATYTIAVLWAYAPPGASGGCAWSSYFEPSGPKGDFTILVARFEHDGAGAGNRIAAEMGQQYGFRVIQTCVQETANRDDGSSVDALRSSYNSDLLLWGTVAKGGQIALQVSPGTDASGANAPILLTLDTIPEVLAKRQLQSYLIQAIEESSLKETASQPAAILADYANRVDAFVQRINWSDDPSEDDIQKIYRLRDKIGIYAAAGRLVLAAGLASNDSARVKKAVAYLALATSTFDGSADPKPVVSFDWKDDYDLALLSDAQLNKDEDSAKLAALRYLKAYQKEETEAPGEIEELYPLAERAASAASELYSITHSQDDAQSAMRLACESLLQLRYYAEVLPLLEQRNRSMAQHGRSPGIAPGAPLPQRTDAYKILVSFGKDPSVILVPGREMKLKDCATF